MKFFGILALFATVASVSAKSCKSGGIYCGQSLLNRGNYHNHIVDVLQENSQPTDGAHIDNSLFDCGGGGSITLQMYCANGCGGVGSTEDDYCIDN